MIDYRITHHVCQRVRMRYPALMGADRETVERWILYELEHGRPFSKRQRRQQRCDGIVGPSGFRFLIHPQADGCVVVATVIHPKDRRGRILTFLEPAY